MQQVMMSDDLTVNEVAKVSGFSAQSVRRWIELGLVKAKRRGLRAYSIPRTELEKINSGQLGEDYADLMAKAED